MNSKWLQQHEQRVREILKKDAPNKAKGFLIAFVVMAGFGVMAFFSSGSGNVNLSDEQMKMTIAGFGFCFVLVLLILLLALGKRKKIEKDPVGDLRAQLQSILLTPQMVEQFDREMAAPPLVDFVCGNRETERIQFTQNFIHSMFLGAANLPDHRFVLYSTVKEMRFAIMRDETKVKGLGKLYMIDLLDANGKKCMGLSVHGREKMDQLESLLVQCCPGIKLQEHKVF